MTDSAIPQMPGKLLTSSWKCSEFQARGRRGAGNSDRRQRSFSNLENLSMDMLDSMSKKASAKTPPSPSEGRDRAIPSNSRRGLASADVPNVAEDGSGDIRLSAVDCAVSAEEGMSISPSRAQALLACRESCPERRNDDLPRGLRVERERRACLGREICRVGLWANDPALVCRTRSSALTQNDGRTFRFPFNLSRPSRRAGISTFLHYCLTRMLHLQWATASNKIGRP